MYFTYRDENRTFQQFGLWNFAGATVTGINAKPDTVIGVMPWRICCWYVWRAASRNSRSELRWVPAGAESGSHVATALRVVGRTFSQGREPHHARNTLVVVQVALALVLLICSGLMIRTFQQLRNVQAGIHPPGTDPDNARRHIGNRLS